MDIDLLHDLNPAQQQAVSDLSQHIQVLAGAGSGKTRVLVYRIAWLIEHLQVSPFGILAVTFTNKAANEMRSRIEHLLRMPVQHMWVGTFHGIAHRLLRMHWQEAGLPQGFQVMDSDDQLRIVKRVQRQLNLDEKQFPPKQAQGFICRQKEEGVRPAKVPRSDFMTETLLKVYVAYEEVCEHGGLVDFAELLLRSYELFGEQPELLQHYQRRFGYILVDEFQDTNNLQYAWLKRLTGKSAKLMVVGDDDQSIYSWRGARVEHMLRFKRDFSDTKVIRLEQNYRSTGVILRAANQVIAHNQNRLGKELWTEGEEGEKIAIYAGFNDIDEARFIIGFIKEWQLSGKPLRQTAILYRSNAQSRVLEEQLLQANIAYRIYGGLRFFERQEIKDALAYLRLLDNRNDDAAFERVINLPPRGIGSATIDNIRQCARDYKISLWQAVQHLLQQQTLAARALNALTGFLGLVENLSQAVNLLNLAELTEHVIANSGIRAYYAKDKTEKGQSRLENLDELVSATSEYMPPTADADMPILTAFLAQAALDAGDHQAGEFTDYVNLMTLHSAKGLEFPLVFLSGLEEGLFPHLMSMQEEHSLEEERRLCYVGMTRAMEKLVLTYAECRRLHGRESFQRPSRFLREIPTEFVQEIRATARVTRPAMISRQPIIVEPQNELGFGLGEAVKHAKFGEGVVLNFEGHGVHARVQVKFARAGVKWLVANFANLEKVAG